MRTGWINAVLIFGGGLGWLVTLQPTPSPFIVVHYGLLIAAIVGAVRVCIDKWREFRKWIMIGGSIAGVFLVVLYSQNDYYESRWTNVQGTNYVDTYHRFSGQLVNRWVFFKDGRSSHGPMAGEGKSKPHGKWTSLTNGEIEYTFYWYGERVSEGEWHLRNK